MKAVKYLYKYIYKGHDKVKQDDGHSIIVEIKQFQDVKWVSPQEAIWRIFQFELNEMSPPVIIVQLHLPNKQTVYYWENRNFQNVLYWIMCQEQYRQNILNHMLIIVMQETICIENFLSIMCGKSKVKNGQKKKQNCDWPHK